MVKRVIITTGQDPLTKPIMDYLTREYGLNLVDDVQRVQLDSAVGNVQTVTVTLLVRAE